MGRCQTLSPLRGSPMHPELMCELVGNATPAYGEGYPLQDLPPMNSRAARRGRCEPTGDGTQRTLRGGNPQLGAGAVEACLSLLFASWLPIALGRRLGPRAFWSRQRRPAGSACEPPQPARAHPPCHGLASYGTSFKDGYRQARVLAGKILAGANPAEHPVTRPAKFEFVVNLQTAKALGLPRHLPCAPSPTRSSNRGP